MDVSEGRESESKPPLKDRVHCDVEIRENAGPIATTTLTMKDLLTLFEDELVMHFKWNRDRSLLPFPMHI